MELNIIFMLAITGGVITMMMITDLIKPSTGIILLIAMGGAIATTNIIYGDKIFEGNQSTIEIIKPTNTQEQTKQETIQLESGDTIIRTWKYNKGIWELERQETIKRPQEYNIETYKQEKEKEEDLLSDKRILNINKI